MKLFTKQPVLIAGIILMGLFLYELNKRGMLSREGVMATSCRSAIVMLKRRTPSNWKIRCKDNNLYVTIKSDLKIEKKEFRRMLYRQLANDINFISKNCLLESLERTNKIVVKLKHRELTLRAYTSGALIVRLSSISDSRLMVDFFKNSVKVKEE